MHAVVIDPEAAVHRECSAVPRNTHSLLFREDQRGDIPEGNLSKFKIIRAKKFNQKAISLSLHYLKQYNTPAHIHPLEYFRGPAGPTGKMFRSRWNLCIVAPNLMFRTSYIWPLRHSRRRVLLGARRFPDFRTFPYQCNRTVCRQYFRGCLVHSGTVKSYDGRKGLGTITRVDTGTELIVDIKALDRAGLGNLTVGQAIDFDVETDHFGRAFVVKLRLV